MGAWDGEGRDVLDQLSRRDHKFASGFTPLPYDGFANLHALTLDLGRCRARSAAAAADDGLCELLQRDLALCGVAGGREADSALCGGAVAGWHVAAHCGRCGIPGGPGADDRRGPDGQAAGGNAAHPADDESADLLGPGADRHRARRADAHDGSSAGARRRCISADTRSRSKARAPATWTTTTTS